MSSPKQDNYRNLANNVIEKLHLRQMDGFYYESSSEALSAVLQMIPEGSAVAYGGFGYPYRNRSSRGSQKRQLYSL